MRPFTLSLSLLVIVGSAYGDEAEYLLQVKAETKERAGYTDDEYAKFEQTLRDISRIAEYKYFGEERGLSPPSLLEDTEEEGFSRASTNYFEGDIILSPEQMDEVILAAAEDAGASDRQRRHKRKLTSSTRLRWPTTINYRIDTASGVSTPAVEAGLNLWRQHTCLRFNRIVTPAGDYMEFFRGSGCFSNVGRIGGRQTVSIATGCTRVGIVAHEIGHALGFWHEQSRPDRDGFVRIREDRILDGTLGNFMKRSFGDVVLNGIPYDFGSVMHYGPTAFTRLSGQYTIETVDPNAQNTIGQRDGLSFYDVKFINQAYCSSVCQQSLGCEHNGYADVNSCQVCRCPDGFGGTFCERAKFTSASCGSIDLTATPSWQTISNSARVTCNWLIKAPAGRNVLIEVDTFSFRRATTCTSDYLEIKVGGDLANTGARMCTSRPTRSFLSAANEAMVIFNGVGGRFTLRYRQDPPDVVVTTPRATTRTTTTTRMTTPSTRATTTTQPTTTTTPVRLTPSTGRTRTTTRRTPPTTAPATTTTPTTEAPPVGWTSWASWTECTAECGGCGLQTRRRTCRGSPSNCVGEGKDSTSQQSRRCNFAVCPASSPKLCSREVSVPCGNTQCTRTIWGSCSPNVQGDPNSPPCCSPFVASGALCVVESATTAAPKTTTTTRRTTTTTWRPPTTAPTTRPATTTRPAPTGGFNPWSAWTPCQVADCGGCGKRYRARSCGSGGGCGGETVQREACNFRACTSCDGRITKCPCCGSLVESQGWCVVSLGADAPLRGESFDIE